MIEQIATTRDGHLVALIEPEPEVVPGMISGILHPRDARAIALAFPGWEVS